MILTISPARSPATVGAGVVLDWSHWVGWLSLSQLKSPLTGLVTGGCWRRPPRGSSGGRAGGVENVEMMLRGVFVPVGQVQTLQASLNSALIILRNLKENNERRRRKIKDTRDRSRYYIKGDLSHMR